MALRHSIETLQHAADYAAIRAHMRKAGLWPALGGALLAAWVLSRVAPALARSEPTAPYGLLLLVPPVCLMIPALLIMVRPAAWGFLVCASAHFAVAGLLGLAGLAYFVFAGVRLLSQPETTEEFAKLLGVGVPVAVLLPSVGTWLYFIGRRRIAMYRRFRGTRMQPPEPPVAQELQTIVREVCSADTASERVVPILREADGRSDARARLEGDLATVVMGEGWHVLFARRSDVAFTPLEAPRAGRPREGLLQLGKVRLKVEMEPPAVDRLSAWLAGPAAEPQP
jgi:hypothetical protein